MEHLVALSASPLERKGGNVGLCGPLKCEKLFSPEDPGDNTSPKFFTVRHGKMVIGRTSFSFLGPTTLFFSEAEFLFNSPVPGIFFFFFGRCVLVGS